MDGDDPAAQGSKASLFVDNAGDILGHFKGINCSNMTPLKGTETKMKTNLII